MNRSPEINQHHSPDEDHINQDDITSATYINNCLINQGNQRLHMEESRYESLVKMSSNLIASIALLSIAIVSSLGFLIQNQKLIIPTLLLGVALVLMVASLFLALLAQRRRHYLVLNNDFSQYFHKMRQQGIMASGAESMWKASAFYLKGLEEHIVSLFERNNAMRNQLNVSLTLLIASVSFVGISTISVIVIVVFIS